VDTPTEPVAGADTPTDEEPGPEEGDEPQDAENTAPPPAEPQGDRCFVSVVVLESSRQSNKQFGLWLPKAVNSRTPVDCASVSEQKLKSEYRELFRRWPESGSEKVLRTQTLSFEPQKKGAPDTRRVVVKVHTRVSEDAP
jgi:hypothetical protein